MISALTGGMPLGSLHFIIALEMALLVFIFAMLFRRGKKRLASILFVIGNAFVSPIPFIYLFDLTFYFALLPSLFIGSLLNTAIAWVVTPPLTTKIQGIYHRGEVKG
ncbi:hypothetical protein [Oceanobacillus bengalensis]|uniref:hypothetical protein n=1 Tax=Oceanobacillus bengalensis TaxID=1435466 RepID=UPI001FE7E20A|nr:hypothetical protein [Oceanobacillus bengalensis]